MPFTFKTLLYRIRDCLFCGQTTFASSRIGIHTEVENIKPVRNTMSLTIETNRVITPVVSVLLSWCCPSAIFWRIMSIIVNAVYRMKQTWTSSHISDEGHEVIAPTLAHHYPASTITRIILRLCVVAPLYHSVPQLPKRMPGKAVLSLNFTQKTTTRYLPALPKIRRLYFYCIAAITDAFTFSACSTSINSLRRILRLNNKFPKALTNPNYLSHNLNIPQVPYIINTKGVYRESI